MKFQILTVNILSALFSVSHAVESSPKPDNASQTQLRVSEGLSKHGDERIELSELQMYKDAKNTYVQLP
ncbi:hypothetical protein CYMTET_31876, partial [Cymbomonas tetramitiformis]